MSRVVSLFLTLLALLCLTSVAAPFTQHLISANQETPASISRADNGDYLIAGRSVGADTVKVGYLVRMSLTGDTVWTTHLRLSEVANTVNSRTTLVRAFSVGGGNIIVLGWGSLGKNFWNSTGAVFIYQLDAAGAVLKDTAVALDASSIAAACMTTDSGFAVAGKTMEDGYVAKFSKEWGLEYGTRIGREDFNDEEFEDVQPLSDNGFVVVGTSGKTSDASHDIWLLKFNAAGDTTLSAIYGQADKRDYGRRCLVQADGSMVIAGWSNNNLFGGNPLAIKVDAAGAVVWQKKIALPLSGFMGNTAGLSATADHGFVLTGESGSPSALWALKLGASGDSLWLKTTPYSRVMGADTMHTVTARSQVLLDNGDIVAVGSVSSGMFNEDFNIIVFGLGADGQSPVKMPSQARRMSSGFIASQASSYPMVNFTFMWQGQAGEDYALELFDMRGRCVGQLHGTPQFGGSGAYRFEWNGCVNNHPLASGQYFCVLKSDHGPVHSVSLLIP